MKTSVNAITQEIYAIPEDANDSKNIESFLRKNEGKKVVVVQGLGFVRCCYVFGMCQCSHRRICGYWG